MTTFAEKIDIIFEYAHPPYESLINKALQELRQEIIDLDFEPWLTFDDAKETILKMIGEPKK